MLGGGDRDPGQVGGRQGGQTDPAKFADQHAPAPMLPPTADQLATAQAARDAAAAAAAKPPAPLPILPGRSGGLYDQGQAAQSALGTLGAGYLAQGHTLDKTSADLRAAAAGNYGQQIDARQQQQQNLDRMKQFYAQGPTASVAQAQMGQAADSAMGARMGAATAGRNPAENAMAMRGAQAANPGLAQFAGQRAQEASAFRGQQLQGIGAQGAGATAMRAGDVNAMNQNFGAANQYGQINMGYNAAAAGALNAGMNTNMGYSKLGENTMEGGENSNQSMDLQNLHNQIALDTAARDNAAKDAARDAAQRAGIAGAIGTGVGAIVGTIAEPGGGTAAGAAGGGAIGTAIGNSSDVRAKQRIVPMPENYGVRY
jgi:hypothetical protein